MDPISIAALNIVIRDLEPEDEPAVQGLFAACDDWFQAATGAPSMPGDVQSLYYGLPEGSSWEDKRLLVVQRGGTVVGLVDAVLHHPGPETCGVGIFLIHPEHRLQALGSLVAAALLDRAGELGITRVSATTPQGWEPGLRFLKSLGFNAVDDGASPAIGPRAAPVGNRRPGPREPEPLRFMLDRS